MKIQQNIAPNVIRLIEKLQSHGLEAYLVGGAVRDLLLGIKPKDYDISTSASPEEIRRIFGRKARIIGRRFRLVHVYMGRHRYEVSTFRRMPTMKERKGRKSDSGLIVWRDNCYGSLDDDISRRDFTVNALYLDPIDNNNIIDNVGGVADLRAGQVRSIGLADVRIAEDPVRMVRACKLVGQYGFTLDDGLRIEIIKRASSLQKCSGSRLLEEIYKILKKPHAHSTLRVCYETGILQYLLPRLAEVWESEAGICCQQIMKIRDDQLSRHLIFPSRLTGFAMMMIPHLKYELRNIDTRQLESNDGGIEKYLYSWIQNFLAPYQIPRHAVAKLVHIILLQQKLLQSSNIDNYRRHPEFDRGRDTFRVYAMGAEMYPDFNGMVSFVSQPTSATS